MFYHEQLVALPRVDKDLYRRHQFVWDAVVASARTSCNDFLYRHVADNLVRIRSAHFSQAKHHVLLPEGRLSVTIVASSDGVVPMAKTLLESWLRDKLRRAGFAVEIAELRTEEWFGRKNQHRIALPIAHVRGAYQVQDGMAASTAMVKGVGRGKRFGAGMIELR